MNGLFHAAAGVAVGALALGGEAGRADLALCAVAGTSPDWDAVLLAISRPLYKRFHRSLTHGFAGLLVGAALAGAALALAAGWDFRRAAYLWLIAAVAHSAADLFNRSGVALLAESHISIHTWPERGYAALDVLMCGASDPRRPLPLLPRAFPPERFELRALFPGPPAPPPRAAPTHPPTATRALSQGLPCLVAVPARVGPPTGSAGPAPRAGSCPAPRHGRAPGESLLSSQG